MHARSGSHADRFKSHGEAMRENLNVQTLLHDALAARANPKRTSSRRPIRAGQLHHRERLVGQHSQHEHLKLGSGYEPNTVILREGARLHAEAVCQ